MNITYYGMLFCTASNYSPATLTAADDNSVGELIVSSTGNPGGFYAVYGISFDNLSIDNGLKYLHIRYAQTAINYFNGAATHDLWHSQIINCGTAISSYYTTNILRNVLVYNQAQSPPNSSYVTGSYFVSGPTGSRIVAENVTIDQVANVKPSSGPLLLFTNTLIVASPSVALGGYAVTPNV